MNKIIPKYGTWVLLILLAAGCGPDRKERKTPGLIDDDEAIAMAGRIEQIKNVYHLCPSPAEMLSMIDMTGQSFEGSLLNPPENIDSYLDAGSQILNLGVYLTDLAYAALFGRREETLDYLEVVRSLAEEVRITGAVDDELIENARTNVEYLDSLYHISNEAFVNMLFFCEKNHQPGTIALLSEGAFVESMYLAINLADEYEEEGYMMQHLAEQKFALENLMAFAESIGDEDASAAEVVNDLKPIMDIYNSLEMQEGAISVQKVETNKLIIGGGSSPVLGMEEYAALKQVTVELRNRITGS